MTDLQELHWINELKAERIRATSLGYAAQTVYLLEPEPRADLSRDTYIHSAGRYSVKKEVKFATEATSLLKHSNSAQNSVKAKDIRTNTTDVETRKNIVQ